MKKFALGILSVFMILGGVLLTGCGKKVSLSIASSDKEIVIYTNYEDCENNKSKEIEVNVKNSKLGINVEFEYGRDCIDISRTNTTTKKANGKYAFKILTKEDKNSGDARIKVSSIENSKKYEYINISVKTIVEEFKPITENSVDGKSDFFVVKGVEKELSIKDYFLPDPVYANVTDVDWVFANDEKEMYVDGKLYASIEGATLKVTEEFSMRQIDVYSVYTINNRKDKVSLEVLDNTTIKNYSVEDTTFYRNGVLQTTQATVALKRNNSALSVAQGVLTLDVSEENSLNLKPVVYRKNNGLLELISKSEYEKYFTFDYTERDDTVNGTKTYNFSIDAIDNSEKNVFGQFEFYLQVDYAGFNYNVSTSQTRLGLDIAYSATGVSLTDSNGYSINGSLQDVFSSYEGVQGYEVKAVVEPSNKTIDDRYFRISFDVLQDAVAGRTLSTVDPVGDIAHFYTQDGEELKFTASAPGANTFVTRAIESGTKIYVKGCDVYDEISDAEFRFEPRSNTNMYGSARFTFYRISEEKNMEVSSLDPDVPLEETTYISSSVYSDREAEFTMKISGIATDSGLTLKNDNVNGFEYVDLHVVETSEKNETESFVVVNFKVKLNAYNFADTSTFWFEHITGKSTTAFKVVSFVPISSLTVQNADKSSANVFIDESASQNFMLAEGQIGYDNTKQSSSLSKLMIEAGTLLPLSTTYQNATLTANGVYYRFMSFDALKMFLTSSEVITDQEALERRANEVIASGEISIFTNSEVDPYGYFNDVEEGYFSISQDSLNVSNVPFKGIVAVLAEGYNENHEEITILRFFVLESFYSVRYLTSNVRSTVLYTDRTLSQVGISRSYADITLSMRQDKNVPTYADSREYFTFISGLQDFYDVTETKTRWKNDFYTISGVDISPDGRNLIFRITANSTNLQTSVRDVLKVIYRDEHGFERMAEIQIEIRNEDRLEAVQWVNRPVDGEIYLNQMSTNPTAKNFTISTSVEPSDANDTNLYAWYEASLGSNADVAFEPTSRIGKTFNVSINTRGGSMGYVYILPYDMIKNIDGRLNVLVYKYVETEEGIQEIPVTILLSNFSSKYNEIIEGSEKISNYFYNNDGEKIYYKDLFLKILLTIADGEYEETAIRVYNQGDLEECGEAKFYRVMNNITLSGWKAYDKMGWTLFGNDVNTTLTFTNGSENFVNTLSGTLRDLTFAGQATVGSVSNNVANAGFLANSITETGSIENCSVDVYYSDGNYYGSALTSFALQNTGLLAGVNAGAIKNSVIYGGSINASLSVYVGGLVGENNGTIEGSGFEFYKFENDGDDTNKIKTAGNVGGLVGFAGSTSVVKTSYVYAYALPFISAGEGGAVDYSSTNLIVAEGTVGVLAGGSSNGAKFVEVFGFIGDADIATATTGSDQYVTLENSYISYFNGERMCTNIYKIATYSYANSNFDFVNGTDETWATLTAENEAEDNAKISSLNLDENIWNLGKNDAEINFGYIYLRNVAQSKAVNLDEVHVEESRGSDGRLRVLNSGNKVVLSEEYETGILFMFNPINQVVDVQEKAILDGLNTISLSTLFGMDAALTRGLLLTSDSRNISISTNAIRLVSPTSNDVAVNEIEITVHSKMDFTQVKTFKFVILNVLPTLSTLIDGVSLKDNQMVLLQTGARRMISYQTLSSLYINSSEYDLNQDSFTINYNYVDGEQHKNFVKLTRSSNSLELEGLKKHDNDASTVISTNLKHNMLSGKAGFENYAEAINDKISRTFETRVYNGAKRLSVANANNLIVRPADYASFEVVLETDEQTDGLVFGLNYGMVAEMSEGFTRFDVDSKLSLDVSWSLLPTSTMSDGVWTNRYSVLVKVSPDKKHLVEENYTDLVLTVNAKSQTDNTDYLKTIKFRVETQIIEDVSIASYTIERRQIRNSILYLTPSSQTLSTISPATDAIVSVHVDPEYAKMSHFTLTYEVSGSSVGTVGISKLAYNSLYGYYINSRSSSIITNGIRVDLTEDDKRGDGLFYFRLYVSSSFASTSNLRLVVKFYDGEGQDPIYERSLPILINYTPDAVITVGENNVTTYLIAKGESVSVTARIGIGQTLNDFYLQNVEDNIRLDISNEVKTVGEYKYYTGQITAEVTATLAGGQDSGIFYVCVSVSDPLSNTAEPKTSRATLCLVDFSVDTKNISVVGSGNKRTYEKTGKSYDVFNAYINDKSELYFNYPLLPEEYNYSKNDQTSVNKVQELMNRRNSFLNNNFYYDERVGYMINYERNMETGRYDPITLKQQLWYASDESTKTNIYNGSRIEQKEAFSITEESLKDGSTRLVVSGKRTGTQLMMLRTIVNYQGIELISDYYFLIVVEVWTDEDSPTSIRTAEELLYYANEAEVEEGQGNYILMNDIVLSDYEPIKTTERIDSLDGNGFTIHINSFKMPTGDSLRLALFDTVESNTTLKNIRVNLYNGGQIAVNVKQYTSVEIAGFAIDNNGVIYNSEVISYYDNKYQTYKNPDGAGNSGLVVKYTDGANTTPIALGEKSGLDTNIVAGFVVRNNLSIANSRVGGDSFKQVIEVEGVNYLQTKDLGVFYLEGQGEVAGFVYTNSGYVSASFAKKIQISNIMEYDGSITAGFVAYNNRSIQNSYVEGFGGETEMVGDEEKVVIYNRLTNISSNGVIAGFVYQNGADGTTGTAGEVVVKNAYANIAIENSKTKGSMVAGFVYKNQPGALVTLCYSACEIAKKDVTQMQFSGIDDFLNSLNLGTISLSYFYNDSRTDETIQSKITTSALAVHDVEKKNSFYGFSFSSGAGAYDGIWDMDDDGKITLVSANQIAVSNRYEVTNGKLTSVFYSRSIRDLDKLTYVDLSYGSAANPIILRNADDFAKATGKATSKEISSYKEYYTDKEVTGRYRIVNNIVMSSIAQDAEDEGSVKLQTSKKVFKGLIDGNGFTISDISLGSSETLENFGLFARLSGAVIMNLSLTVETVHDSLANIVGVLAGTAVNSRILAINLAPAENATSSSTAVQGKNIVGGVVGMLLGNSFMSDVSVSSIEVSAEDSIELDENKHIYYFRDFIEGNTEKEIKSIRVLAQDLDRNVGLNDAGSIDELSYAGGVAGFVDTYQNIDEGSVAFSTTTEITEYDIITVSASNSVNIYAEIAGGLFGYVGKSTLVYDASLSVNQNEARTTNGASPSYIISKNLLAGGLIGENYGGLFAVSATYADELQQLIESGNGSNNSEHTYYTSGSGEHGQTTIFSYSAEDADERKNNNPLFIGGLVGYMGAGYIYVGQSKLNVISNTDAIVGGVVGLSGISSNRYNLNFTNERREVNELYFEVFASGDVYSKGNVASGILGAIEATESSSAIVAMKNVLAVNYYSYTGSALNGDTLSAEGTSSYTSDRHFMLVGGIYSKKTKALKAKTTRLASDFYLINNMNFFSLNIKDGTVSNKTGWATVGGYRSVGFGSSTATIKEFGFETPASSTVEINTDGVKSIVLKTYTLEVQHISNADYETISSAYSRMRNYFVPKGWDEKYWAHEKNQLFPEIVLLPKVTIAYWDTDNTAEILQLMNGSSTTIVVRGSLEHENDDCLERADIDLTGVDGSGALIENFRGRLVSFETYMNSQEGGKITAGRGKINGGADGERVGIILNRPLFEKISGNVSIEGLTFYMDHEAGKGFSLVENEAETALFRNVNVVLNRDVTISSSEKTMHTDAGTYHSIGLLAGLASSSSFFNIDIRFRGDANTIIFNHDDGAATEVYMGILAGRLRQKSTSGQMAINGLSLTRMELPEDGEVEPIELKYYATGQEGATGFGSVYAGIYAGEISKVGSGAAVTVSVKQINDVNMYIKNSSGNAGLNNVYIGGFAGQLGSADRIDLVEGPDDSQNGSGITIYQQTSITNLYAGLAFGHSTSSVQFAFDRVPSAWLIGRIIQEGCVVSNIANIGSVIGKSENTVTLSGLRAKFSVANIEMFKDGEKTSQAKFEQNLGVLKQTLFEYTTLHPFVVSGTGDKNAVGGVVGYSSGALTLSGTSILEGGVVVSGGTSQLSVGGVLGQFSGDNNIAVGGTLDAAIDIYANASEVFAGGFIGNYSSSKGTLEIGTAGSALGDVKYAGQVVVETPGSSKVHFGGAVGKLVSGKGGNVIINGYAFGGALKNLVSDGGTLTAGGIVGEFDTASLEDSQIKATIENCLAYGDIFSIYPKYEDGNFVASLYNFYTFGGIVGVAQKGLTIKSCSSLLTNFNSANIKNGTSVDSGLSGDVGAIVGLNADAASANFETGTVKYEGNKYSSGVNLAIQEQEGNIDCAYGVSGDLYQGYTTKVVNDKKDDKKDEKTSNILDGLKTSIDKDAQTGHKLNPYMISTFSEDQKLDKEGVISGNLNNIKWAAIANNLQNGNDGNKAIRSSIATNLSNIAIVGNGLNVERIIDSANGENKNSSKIVYAGGIVDVMGTPTYKIESAPFTTAATPNFNLISNMIVKLDVAQNIMGNGFSNGFGGVAGFAAGNSFVYGVGVKGDLSVGGDTNINLGGIIGVLQEGRIEQCYVDADITYRGLYTGCVSGVANLQKLSSTIKATYSSGKIISYVNAPIYTFASVSGAQEGITRYLSDCYSITQIEKNNLFGSTNDAVLRFTGTVAGTGQDSISVNGKVVNGTSDVEKQDYVDKVGENELTSDDMALSYEDEVKINEYTDTNGIVYGAGMLLDRKADGTISATQAGTTRWYFSRFTNYGYASHGFGFLKNSTTYTRSGNDANGYVYTPVSYNELLSGEEKFATASWYLGIPSVDKFVQMLSTVDGNSGTYTKPYRFFLRYGLKATSAMVGKDIGKAGQDFALDGNNNTIDLSGISNLDTGFFNSVIGSISNLRIVNGKTTSVSKESAGILAGKLTGTLYNITVVGDVAVGTVTDTVAKVGGVVGSLNGTATKIESLVNITSTGNNIIGGVVGKLDGILVNEGPTNATMNGKISYASSAGIINNKPTTKGLSIKLGDNELKINTMKFGTGNSTSTISQEKNTAVHAVAGGIVGQVTTGRVEDSYNGNSVLANYYSKDSAGGNVNVIAGGIVGFACGSNPVKIAVSRCVNVGLVGTGNYKTADISYAGGIVGYAQYLTMTSCVNDGAVQSLSKINNKNYKVKTEKSTTNVAGEVGYTNNPSDLRYKITLTYNVGEFRTVNAYGLGYAENGSIDSTNKSSTSNVKNDGNIGEFITESYLMFNRMEMLDGDGKNGAGGNYEAKFKVGVSAGEKAQYEEYGEKKAPKLTDLGLTISGVDSYGFPTRVYGTDEITRRLTSSHPFATFVSGKVSNDGVEVPWNGAKNATRTYKGNATVGYAEDGSVNALSTTQSDSFDYQMSVDESTTYYTSSILSRYWAGNYKNFDGYDAILQEVNGYTHLVDKTKGTASAETQTNIDNKLKNIDSQINPDPGEGFKNINVAGTYIGIAKSEGNIKSILSPYTLTIPNQTFNLAADKNIIDWSSVQLAPITFKTTSGRSVAVQGADYKLVVDQDAGRVTMTGDSGDTPTIFFAEQVSGTLSIGLTYSSNLQSFEITKNNAEFANGKLIVKLAKVGLSEDKLKLLKDVKKTSKNNSIKEVVLTTSDGQEIHFDATKAKIEKNSMEVYTLEITGTGELTETQINRGSILINLNVYDIENIQGAVVVNSSNGSNTSTTLPSGDAYKDVVFNFTNYTKNTQKAFPSTGWTLSGGNYTMSTSNFVSAIGGVNTSNVFGYTLNAGGNEFAIYYDGALTIEKKSGSVEMSVSGSTITISGSDAQAFITAASGTDVDLYYQLDNPVRDLEGGTSQTVTTFEREVGPVDLLGSVEMSKGDYVFEKTTNLDDIVFIGNGSEGNYYTVRYTPTNEDFALQQGGADPDINVTTPIEISSKNIKLKAVKVYFHYHLTYSVDTARILSNEAYEVRVNRGGTTVGLGYFGGYLEGSNTNLDIKLGDTVSAKSVRNSYSPTAFTMESDSALQLVMIDEEGNEGDLSYVVEQGSGNIFGETSTYVSTTRTVTEESKMPKSVKEISVEYKIWGNGVIEIESQILKYNSDGEVTSNEVANYIFLPRGIASGISHGEIGYEQLEDGTLQPYNYDIIWGSFDAGFHKLKKEASPPGSTKISSITYSSNGTISESDFSRAQVDGDDMTIDLISTGFRGSNLNLSRNNVDTSKGKLTFKARYTVEITRDGSVAIDDIKVGNTEDKFVGLSSATSISIKGKKGTEDVSYTRNTTISEEGKYQLTAYGTQTKTMTGNVRGDGSVPADKLLLASDISMRRTMGSESTLDKEVIGDNYIIRFVSSGDTMFGTMSAPIRDTVFAGTKGGASASSLLATTISGNISQTRLYGSTRNVVYNNAESTVYANYGTAGSNVSIKNFVSLTGTNAVEGADVGVTLTATGFDSDDVGVFVAGDAVIGKNAFDLNTDTAKTSYNTPVDTASTSTTLKTTLWRLNSTVSAAGNGGNGHDGKVGGQITGISAGATVQSIGYSSIGGYGGDGAHGRYSGEIAIGGGKAGSAGSEASATGKTLKFRDTKPTQIGGNAGIGGFGRVTKNASDYSFYIHTSGNGGTATVAGANGVNRGSDSFQHGSSGKGWDVYFGARVSEYCDNGSHKYDKNYWGNSLGEWRDTWVTNSFATVKTETDAVKVGLYTNGDGNSPTKTKKIYLYAHVEPSWKAALVVVWWKVNNDNRWYKIAWTSGESVNLSGACYMVNK